jgi:hypothetical protein
VQRHYFSRKRSYFSALVRQGALWCDFRQWRVFNKKVAHKTIFVVLLWLEVLVVLILCRRWASEAPTVVCLWALLVGTHCYVGHWVVV